MTRLKRYQMSDVSYLVSQRGHNRLPTFYDGEDYLTFLKALEELTQKYECELHSWSLIPDGYWLLLTPKTSTGISKVMQTLGRLYVRYINSKYGRTGTLWASRYRACLVEPVSDEFQVVEAFIHTAAIRNGIISEEDVWPWQHQKTSDSALCLYNPTFADIESALVSGLAFGSAAFLSHVQETTSLRVVPLKRGRPRKHLSVVNVSKNDSREVSA